MAAAVSQPAGYQLSGGPPRAVPSDLVLAAASRVVPADVVQKLLQTYEVFDTTLKRPMPYRYAGTGTIGGISVYKYVEQVPPTQAGAVTLPGALAGFKQKSVTLPEYDTADNTVWVDPQTGAVVDVSERQKLDLRDSAGAVRLLLFDADLAMTPQSQQAMVRLDKSGRGELTLIKVTLPLVVGLVGLAALIVGFILARPRRDDQLWFAQQQVPEPALGPTP